MSPGDCERPPADAGDDSPLVESLEARAERLEREVGELEALLDRAREDELRLLADLDNLRKRARHEAAAARDEGCEQVLREVILLLDGVQRGLAATEAAADDASASAVLEGLRLIERGIADVLGRHGVERIPTVGERFDPRLHEAADRIPATAEHPDGVVVAEQQAGYRRSDRVLRPAQVVVAVAERPADDD